MPAGVGEQLNHAHRPKASHPAVTGVGGRPIMALERIEHLIVYQSLMFHQRPPTTTNMIHSSVNCPMVVIKAVALVPAASVVDS